MDLPASDFPRSDATSDKTELARRRPPAGGGKLYVKPRCSIACAESCGSGRREGGRTVGAEGITIASGGGAEVRGS